MDDGAHATRYELHRTRGPYVFPRIFYGEERGLFATTQRTLPPVLVLDEAPTLAASSWRGTHHILLFRNLHWSR